MLITVLPDGEGAGAGAALYFVGSHDSRGRLRQRCVVHRGDPVQVAAVIDCIDEFLYRYTSIVVNFGQNLPTPSQITGVLNDLQAFVYAGVDPRHHCALVVEHGKQVDGVMVIDLHMLAPRVDIKTGRSYNAMAPGWERPMGFLTDAWNFELGWMRGTDPLRLRPGRRRKKIGGAEEGVLGDLIDVDRARKARLMFEREVARRVELYRRMYASPRRRYTRLLAPTLASHEDEDVAVQALLNAAGAANAVGLRVFLTAPVPTFLDVALGLQTTRTLKDRNDSIGTATARGPGANWPSEQDSPGAGRGVSTAIDLGAGFVADRDAANQRRDTAAQQLQKAVERRQRAFDAIGTLVERVAGALQQAASRLSLLSVERARQYLAQLFKPGGPRPGGR